MLFRVFIALACASVLFTFCSSQGIFNPLQFGGGILQKNERGQGHKIEQKLLGIPLSPLKPILDVPDSIDIGVSEKQTEGESNSGGSPQYTVNSKNSEEKVINKENRFENERHGNRDRNKYQNDRDRDRYQSGTNSDRDNYRSENDEHRNDRYDSEQNKNNRYENDGRRDDRYDSEQNKNNRYDKDRTQSNRYEGERNNGGRYDLDRNQGEGDRYQNNKYEGDRNQANRYDGDRNQSNRYEVDRNQNNRYDGDRNQDNRYDGDRNQGNRYDGDSNQGNRYDGDRNQGNRYDGDRNPDNRYDGDRNQNNRYEGDRNQGNRNDNDKNKGNRYESNKNKDSLLGNRFGTPDIIQSEEKPNKQCRWNSKTTVNGQPMCKGDVIFEEDFKILDPSKWTTEVKLSGAPDYQFVVYMNHQDNINIRRNRLKLMPTLGTERFGDNYINDEINLGRNCTGIPGTTDCNRKAESYLILPPIISSRIHTKDTFSFRYGRIEIIAKLPKGDWIYPEIFLVPKAFVYGPEYDSGQMRIAFTYGNEAMGKVLHGGYILGTSPEGRMFGMSNTTGNELWADSFHNYTLKWTPDGIHAGVDGQIYANLVPPANGFASIAQMLQTTAGQRWAEGERNAPFDKEMCLLLGVGVGGYSFPDNILNKPWKNKSPKNTLMFWKDKDNWHKTWGPDSALRVESIKIWAL